MINLRLQISGKRRLRLLFLGAHSDDIEIGCGGTVIELLKRYRDSEVKWVVLSGNDARAKEALASAGMFLRGVKRKQVILKKFRECYFPSEYPEIKNYFDELGRSYSPDIVFCHYRDDLHQDHRIVGELAWNTFRDHLILEYEIPKFDGGIGSPGVFMPLDDATVRRKLAILMKAFVSQHSKSWFTPETFSGLMRLRGIESNAQSGYSEAFYGRKLLLG